MSQDCQDDITGCTVQCPAGQYVACVRHTCTCEPGKLLQCFSFWLNGMVATDTERISRYITLYNHTYDAIKTRNPNMLVGGPAIAWYTYYPNSYTWMEEFVATLPTRHDFISFHIYPDRIDIT